MIPVEDIVTLLSLSLTSMTPLLLASAGEILTEKSGVVNIGLEGIMILSALTSAIITHYTGNPYLALLISSTVGLATGLLMGYLSSYLHSNQIVVGTGINMLALGVATLALYRLWGEYGGSPSVEKLADLQLPIGNAILTLKPVSVIAVVLAVASWYLLEKTTWGLRIRACGENPHSAEAMGVNVYRTRLLLTGVGGFYTGLAGSFLVVNWVGFFSREMTSGRGFVALANVSFSNWNPLTAIAGAFLFGFFEAFATWLSLKVQQLMLPEYLTFLRTSGQNLFKALPYLATLITVVVIMKKVKMPRALGKPYIKE
ncbi:ABC transporter permease [Thermosphaera chiliense]|uniref:ABC transporter permease n=1 Tax=Thermosphaera chiliense TaxID=3402707 RepID=A0A7M1UPP0_9CREN|nr:ABC transporter permease [Thermosphaera aggregans]QOR94225.1 ABC transporter permease [Thermosphaera aggregans]